MIQLLLNTTTPPFQLLPMPKVDQSLLRIHEAPPLQKAKKSQVILDCIDSWFLLSSLLCYHEVPNS